MTLRNLVPWWSTFSAVRSKRFSGCFSESSCLSNGCLRSTRSIWCCSWPCSLSTNIDSRWYTTDNTAVGLKWQSCGRHGRQALYHVRRLVAHQKRSFHIFQWSRSLSLEKLKWVYKKTLQPSFLSFSLPTWGSDVSHNGLSWADYLFKISPIPMCQSTCKKPINWVHRK